MNMYSAGGQPFALFDDKWKALLQTLTHYRIALDSASVSALSLHCSLSPATQCWHVEFHALMHWLTCMSCSRAGEKAQNMWLTALSFYCLLPYRHHEQVVDSSHAALSSPAVQDVSCVADLYNTECYNHHCSHLFQRHHSASCGVCSHAQ